MRAPATLLLIACLTCRLGQAAAPAPAAPAAAATAAPAKPVATAPTAAADALSRVEALIGTAACRSDADCQTIGVGHRACGGPARYLAWSSWRTSGHALERAAAPTRVPAPASGDMPNMSTCQVLVDPGARCQPAGASAAAPGRCALRSADPLRR